jgi:hypothetical protein
MGIKKCGNSGMMEYWNKVPNKSQITSTKVLDLWNNGIVD